jgi:hypothetical protein
MSVLLALTAAPTVVQRASATEVAEALVVAVHGDAVRDVRQHVPHDCLSFWWCVVVIARA